MQQVIVTIEAGVPTIRVSGVKGKGCKDLTRDLETALGGARKSRPTQEMYEKQSQKAKASY